MDICQPPVSEVNISTEIIDMIVFEPFEKYGPWMQVVNRRSKKPIGGKNIDNVSSAGRTNYGVKLGRFAALGYEEANMMEESRQEMVSTDKIYAASKGDNSVLVRTDSVST
ncbi:hypothetical protein V6N13_143058 [Hibiscus sabdariffa]